MRSSYLAVIASITLSASLPLSAYAQSYDQNGGYGGQNGGPGGQNGGHGGQNGGHKHRH